MPEGHALHRLARDHRPFLKNQAVAVSSPQGRFKHEARQLDGLKVLDTEAIGKHLLYRFENDQWLHIHLGLYGKFRDTPLPAGEPIGQVRVRLISSKRCIDLNGPNQCEIFSAAQRQSLLDRLGPDPLRADATANDFCTHVLKTRQAIGAVLLDQSKISGVGNIYRSEILFDQKLSPFSRGMDLSQSQAKKIWRRLAGWMKIGVEQGKIVTKNAGRKKTGVTKGNAGERFHVYKVQQCHVCGSTIESVEQAARTLYFCPSCQTGEDGPN
jgi:endonuclease-8